MFALVTEELTQACASTAMIYVMHTPAARAIAGGAHLTALAFSEVGSLSHFWAPVSSLIPRDGCFETSARKAWVTSTNHADSYVASAQAHDASSIFETTLYIACRRGGIAVAGGFDGLGLRGNDSARVVFENAPIPESDLLTPPGEGAHDMLRVVFPWFCVGDRSNGERPLPGRRDRHGGPPRRRRATSGPARNCATCRRCGRALPR